MKRLIYLTLAVVGLHIVAMHCAQKNNWVENPLSNTVFNNNPLYKAPSKNNSIPNVRPSNEFKDNPLYQAPNTINNAVDAAGNTALHTAAKNLNKVEIERLLAQGADINAQNKNGQTPFHYVLAGNELADLQALYNMDVYALAELVAFMYANGANIFAVDKFGNTPMHYALKTTLPSWEVIEALLQYSPDNYILQIPNRAGIKPADLLYDHVNSGRIKLYDFITVNDDGLTRNARENINKVISSFTPEQLNSLRAANKLPILMPEVVAPERPEPAAVSSIRNRFESVLRRLGQTRRSFSSPQ